ncbi:MULTISPECIES: CaiB/BaiF CoA transferase family protein [Achromobacter]|uniref:CoA-transferase family III family protein 52 n=2 Tax=Achromobacter TaxID=222 RepID=E3HY13_ACHXA|nr:MULTISPECIES: CaiB/BaiF CoA-transferase family protein [Achromobacter]ADP19967.1 CoA-transferase family III family protein 52 [Achromobacter xylosoxidans A8]AVG44053.1 CoA transferase [Achromobacter insolitus]CAB3848878.1 Acetyl-CoA:oxalate CoA-transferase [Achromobacter aegrifaciens]CAB3911242.1 Acetyl-CoA:oxalate CoA-transferase [Achromobacter mucicolens]
MPGSLSHLRILDLTRVLAGPWCTQMLADMGADVIKVERPVLGDDTRHWGPPWINNESGERVGDSAYFTSANRNKRSIAIDIATEQGQALVRELAQQSDVLVENYKVGDLARYGLSYAELRELNPRLVYCSITGYGQDGPYSHLPGYDFIFQGEGGLMSITGERDDKPGGGPMKSAIAVADVLTGLNATIGILTAIEGRHATGLGQHIDVALLDTVVNFGANQIASYFASGAIPRRWGNEHPNLAPYQTFATADGHIIIGCGNDGQFRKLCALIRAPELAGDPRFLSMPDRNVNRAALVETLEAIFRSQPSAHWLGLLANSEVPNGSINNYAQVFEHPQVVHRGLRVEMPHPGGTTVSVVANPIRLSGTPVEYRFAPPLRGQHTAEVLSALLGRSPDDIAALEAARIIETRNIACNTASTH